MILFRTTTGVLLVRHPADQFFMDPNHVRFYVNAEGSPVDQDGRSVPGALVTKFVYTPEEYLRAFPKAERHRISGDNTAIVQTLPNYSCLEGNCYRVRYLPGDPRVGAVPCVLIDDGDDAYTRKIFTSEEEAQGDFLTVLALAPFIMSELDAFGFKAE